VSTRAELIVEELKRHDVEVVFGLPGVHNLALWEALRDSGIRLVGVRHEQTAVYAADGLARATGRVGVALTTTGPGAANALGATGEAWAAGSPVLIIATDIPSTLRRPGVYRGVLHETRDQGAMFEPIVKDVVHVTPELDPAVVVWDAIEDALEAHSGPVYIEIPTDLLSGESAATMVFMREPRAALEPEEAHVEHAVALCVGAERPLIWAGGGAARAAGAREAVSALAATLGAPVIETYLGRGLLDPADPSWVGLPPHLPQVGALWDEADLVVTIGSDLDGMTTQNWLQPQPPKLIAINVDPDDACKNYRVDHVVEADAALGAAAMAEGLASVRHAPAASPPDLEALRAAARADLDPDGAAFLDTIAEALDPDTVVFADMCIPGYWIAGQHPFDRPRKLAYPMGWGTLGFGFPASIGAAIGQDDPVLCVCGDGGFLFAAGELATVAQEQAPLTILLWDDGGYGMLRYDQKRAGSEPYGVDLNTPDWVGLAESFGITAERATTLDSSQLRAHLANREPSMLVVEAPPLVPPPTTSPRWYRRNGA
jgi:acetolactate synthase-1/2/3 large subunit